MNNVNNFVDERFYYFEISRPLRRGINFIFDSVQLLNHTCHQVNFGRGNL